MWQMIAEGSSLEEFQASGSTSPYSELAHDAPAELIIQTPWYLPIAPLADLFGAEWVADRLLNEAGMVLVDVEADGYYKIIVHMKGDIGFLLAAVIVIASICGVAALAISYMSLRAFIGVAPAGTFTLLAVAAVVAAAALLASAVKKKVPIQKGGN